MHGTYGGVLDRSQPAKMKGKERTNERSWNTFPSFVRDYGAYTIRRDAETRAKLVTLSHMVVIAFRTYVVVVKGYVDSYAQRRRPY